MKPGGVFYDVVTAGPLGMGLPIYDVGDEPKVLGKSGRMIKVRAKHNHVDVPTYPQTTELWSTIMERVSDESEKGRHVVVVRCHGRGDGIGMMSFEGEPKGWELVVVDGTD